MSFKKRDNDIVPESIVNSGGARRRRLFIFLDAMHTNLIMTVNLRQLIP